MAPQDSQLSVGESSDSTGTADRLASQHPLAKPTRGQPSPPPPRSGRSLKVAFSSEVLTMNPDDAPATLRRQPDSDGASSQCETSSEADAFSKSGSSCLKTRRGEVPTRSCLKAPKCLKNSPCLKNAAVDDADDSAMTSSSAIESGSDHDVSEKNDDAFTDASTPGADSSRRDSSDDKGPSDCESTHKSAASASASSGNWSASKDCLLRSMKESKDQVPWADIGKALGRSKSDFRARWVSIRGKPALFAYSDDLGDDDQDSSAQQSRDDPDPSEKPGNAPHQALSAAGDDSQSASDVAHVTKVKGKAKTATPTKWHKGQRNDKVAMENKAARSKFAAANERECDILSGEEASSESSGFLGDDDEDDEDDDDEDDGCDAGGLRYGWPESRRQDMRYLRRHVYPELYPREIQPEPDEFFSEHDCAVLAAVDSKYKKSRWLEMQANFYNVTGRMVPLHLIRDKCERADRENAVQPRPSSSSRQRVESWVDGVQDENLEDPAL